MSQVILEKSKVDLNGDGIGYVQQYDFSRANLNETSRIEAVTTVASVCYQNPKAIGSIKLYDRLSMENKGLPSSSYEFVPILLDLPKAEFVADRSENKLEHIYKFGEIIIDKKTGIEYLLTNLRALITDIGEEATNDMYFNTEEECEIINDNFKVFRADMDLNTSRQFIRHRMSPQELSRRYVSGKKKEFSFYISDKMKDVCSSQSLLSSEDGLTVQVSISTQNIMDICINHYNTAINQGISPEEARRCIPQAMYTTIWSAWQPRQLEVFFKLRLDNHAQREIRWLAEGMKKLILN